MICLCFTAIIRLSSGRSYHAHPRSLPLPLVRLPFPFSPLQRRTESRLTASRMAEYCTTRNVYPTSPTSDVVFLGVFFTCYLGAAYIIKANEGLHCAYLVFAHHWPLAYFGAARIPLLAHILIFRFFISHLPFPSLMIMSPSSVFPHLFPTLPSLVLY